MVEANPDNQSKTERPNYVEEEIIPVNQSKTERINYVEEEIFDKIDEEIRDVKDKNKKKVQKLTQTYENLARRHLSIVHDKL